MMSDNSFRRYILGGLLALSISGTAQAGLDIYSGSLAKFYKNDYTSTQALAAKELGMEFKTVFPDGEPKWLTEGNADKKVKKFLRKIETDRAGDGIDITHWNEGFNEYHIEQLGWENLSALIYITAYTIRQDLQRPTNFSGVYEDYEAYQDATEKGYYFGPLLILESDLFIPSQDSSVVIQENPLKEELVITTTFNLRMTLEFLNKNVWSGKARPDEWLERGPAASEPYQAFRLSEDTGEPEMIEVQPLEVEDIALHNAEYAYAVLFKVMSFSEENQMPIAMDG